mgnify:CR=1 FL=1
MTDLPIVLKGVGSVETAKQAVENGVEAIVLSNHGGRQVDGSQSALETALEIHRDAPEIFEQLEVYADGGVRYGSDVIKLLSLGVRAVGLGRTFMYANVFGQEGIEKAIEQLKYEIAIDAANVGIADLKKIDPSYVSCHLPSDPLKSSYCVLLLTCPTGQLELFPWSGLSSGIGPPCITAL